MRISPRINDTLTAIFIAASLVGLSKAAGPDSEVKQALRWNAYLTPDGQNVILQGEGQDARAIRPALEKGQLANADLRAPLNEMQQDGNEVEIELNDPLGYQDDYEAQKPEVTGWALRSLTDDHWCPVVYLDEAAFIHSEFSFIFSGAKTVDIEVVMPDEETAEAIAEAGCFLNGSKIRGTIQQSIVGSLWGLDRFWTAAATDNGEPSPGTAGAFCPNTRGGFVFQNTGPAGTLIFRYCDNGRPITSSCAVAMDGLTGRLEEKARILSGDKPMTDPQRGTVLERLEGDIGELGKALEHCGEDYQVPEA